MSERTLNFGTDATDADYQIRDTSGTGGDLIIEHLPTGATFEYDATENAWIPTDPIGTATRPASAITTTSVNTDEAQVTGETLVKAHRENDTSTITAGDRSPIVDTEDDDNLDEFDSNFEFTPNETGDYYVYGAVRFTNPADQDRFLAQVRDKGNDVIIDDGLLFDISAGAAESHQIPFYERLTLNSSTTYQFLARNNTSDYVLSGAAPSGAFNCKLRIERCLTD
jgi:hypothetical protein